MKPYQKFRRGSQIVLIAVRQDTDGTYYSELTDIQDTFPDASGFEVGGVTLVYLKDENNQRHSPLRIEHFPDDIVDVFTTVLKSQYAAAFVALPVHIEPYFPEEIEQQSTSTLSLLPPHACASIPISSYDVSSTLNSRLYRDPLAALSTIAAATTQTLHVVERSSAQSAANHLELLNYHNDLLKQNNELLMQQNLVLQRQEDARLLSEETLKIQKQAVDRLIVAQQRVDALLVQNYELHEYPIPRRFVILPESYKTFDPRRVVKERFRLFFLCECGEQCSADADQEKDASHPIPAKNQVHLANHAGYELTRPTEFYNRYGPYVLGMLRILKHCLVITSVVAPAVSLAHDQVSNVMQGVESIAKNTVEAAINSSITFLEKELGNSDAADDVRDFRSLQPGDDLADMMSDLRALEGADLRRLDTFLRNADEDKILGNLYRIVTTMGHVKWVCLEHYNASYRAFAMKAFIQTVETAGGTYYPQLAKVVITLTSRTGCKDFFGHLAGQASTVAELDVTFKWGFGSSDLSTFVEDLARSNVTIVKLDLKDNNNIPISGILLKYTPLLKLFSNRKLQGLQITGSNSFGDLTSKLSKHHHGLSSLRSFRHLDQIKGKDWIRLLEIISVSPDLIDLRLGALSNSVFESLSLSIAVEILSIAIGSPGLFRANQQRYGQWQGILSLTHLQSLHICGDIDGSMETIALFFRAISSTSTRLRELVYIEGPRTPEHLEEIIQASATSLEVLILEMPCPKPTSDIAVAPPTQSTIIPFSKLSHLHMSVGLSSSTFDQLMAILPNLELVHFGTNLQSKQLLPHLNFSTLQSLSLFNLDEEDLQPMIDAFLLNSQPCILKTLYLGSIKNIVQLPNLLKVIPLEQLYLFHLGEAALGRILPCLNMSKLSLLAILDVKYDWPMEAILVSKSQEFVREFCLHLGKPDEKFIEIKLAAAMVERMMKGVFSKNSRTPEGLLGTLPLLRISLLEADDFVRQYWQSIVSNASH
ncbi:hypothetical protein BGZ95_003188 [Linnemannia exigua]|uniref:Uncharacterized protein n=1 Tax=Linnemannia exigua TaxID=604196 RepID=A0AAD4D4K4_9FUNG|nr:hypothetical protein BGZ95_003188 [Linnemannia exigua]